MEKQRALIIRKLVHLLTGLLILMLTYIIERNVLLLLIMAGSVFSFATFRLQSFRLVHQTTYKSLGTLFYPVGILGSFLLLYNLPLPYFRTALMVLTVSDLVAFLFGQINKKNLIFRIGGDKKSLFGVIAFTLSNVVVISVFLPHQLLSDVFYVLALLFLAAGCETISWRGSDNLSIPLGLALFFLFQHTRQPDFLFVSVVLLVVLTGASLLYKWGILTRYGSLVAGLLGVYLLVLAGWNWILPVLFFFISSVLFTRINPAYRQKSERSYGRNAWQVLANILWALLSSVLFLITRNELFIFLFIAAVAAVTADTWASEIGPLVNKKSFSVADWKMHPAGITGGISLGGTLAALAGAFLVSAGSYVLFFDRWNGTIVALLTSSAFLACFADTFLGAFVEENLQQSPVFKKRKNPESIEPNDLINLAGSFTALLFFVVLRWLVL